MQNEFNDKDSKENESFDYNFWKHNCIKQKELKDTRSHPICVAAAFSLIPFPLTPVEKPERIKNVDIFQQGNVHKEYDLVVVTVDSNYKYNKSPTAKSACPNNIKLHILGKGIKNFYSKGLGAKVQLLNNFIANIPTEEVASKIILFVDGTDVLFQVGPEDILRRFKESNARILFSGEYACFPMVYNIYNII